ncbi:MAG: hypothetical protein ACR2LE_04780 [Nocardioidaceae bacterium]
MITMVTTPDRHRLELYAYGDGMTVEAAMAEPERRVGPEKLRPGAADGSVVDLVRFDLLASEVPAR